MSSKGGTGKVTLLKIFAIFQIFKFVASTDLNVDIFKYLHPDVDLVKDSPDFFGNSKMIPPNVEFEAPTMGVKVEGFQMKTVNDRTIYAFQGIRYAPEPDRFQPPELLDADYYSSQGEVYDALHLPKKCSQVGFLDHSLAVGTQDCLFLNIYTPQNQSSDGSFNSSLPVMIFIYGGGFTIGDTFYATPNKLLDKDVILVAIQYRVGLFGFFSTGNDKAKGNAGLYDQRMAMKWVKTYIGDFGGNPDMVTIFGESAGGASVSYHLLSQSSKGLFKGVIAESGNALNNWALDSDPVKSAQMTAEALGCEGDNTNMDDVLDCVNSASEDEIVLALNDLSDDPAFTGSSPIVQDFLEASLDPIVASHPTDAFSNGDLLDDVSLMIGNNRDEGSYSLSGYYWGYLYPNHLADNGLYLQEYLIAEYLKQYGIDDKTHALSVSLADEYFGDANRRDFDSISPGMIDLVGMLYFKAGAYQYAKLHSLNKDQTTNAKTFYYTFDYLSDDTMLEWLVGGKVPPFSHGVTHTDELMYLLSLPANQNETEVQIRERMIELWTNFAYYQDPTPDSSSWKDVLVEKWAEFNITDQYYMVMEENFHMEQFFTKRWPINTQEDTEGHSRHDRLKRETKIQQTAGLSGEHKDGDGDSDDLMVYCADEINQLNSLQQDYLDLDHTTNLYMGFMIAFVTLFGVICIQTIFLFYKVQVKK